MHKTVKIEKAFLVGLQVPPQPGVLDVHASLAELEQLAQTAGLTVVGSTHQRVYKPDPKTYIRSGKVNEVKTWLAESEATTVIFDDELSPRHQRELERAFGEGVRILDRTTLILDIFAQHAHTKEGALQVELAQYEYRLPRLTRAWTHLARQAGGGSIGGGSGGVGLRGPGETQLETDRREIGRKISFLKGEIEKVRAHRERYRARRRREGIPVCALIGYTNAGKSTLLNRLSGSTVYAADQLFATLDPTTRRVMLPNGKDVLFTDTVGFIQKLPTNLVAAFRATLEEVNQADVLIHVVDATHPFAVEQAVAVEVTLLEDLGIEDLSLLVVFNKADQLEEADPDVLAKLRSEYPEAVFTSGYTGQGIDDLLEAVVQHLNDKRVKVTVAIPYTAPDVIAHFYEVADVEHEDHNAEGVQLTGRLDPRYRESYEPYVVEGFV